MTRILRATLVAYAFSALTSLVLAQDDSSAATATSAAPAGAIETLGCYDTLGTNSDVEDNNTFQTSGACQSVCTAKGAKVMITSGGTSCYCGDSVPPASAKVDSDQCNIGCGGYNLQTCGGLGTYQYYLTGLGAPVIEKDNSTTSAKPSATTSAVESARPAVTSTTPSPSPSSSGGGGSSKVGIAVGVVVGVIAVAAIAGVAVFFYRRRRNQKLEEEHARNAAINGFAKGPKSEASSANDSRLDPSIYSARRDSLGSIADERDFSRRILQVSETHRGPLSLWNLS
jgi:cell wall integrity and stress response component